MALQLAGSLERLTMTDLVKQNTDLVHKLPKCEFEMTHMEGTHIAKTRGILNGRSYKVTADVTICKYCGNFPGADANRKFCPALMKSLPTVKEQL